MGVSVHIGRCQSCQSKISPAWSAWGVIPSDMGAIDCVDTWRRLGVSLSKREPVRVKVQGSSRR